MNIPIHPDGVDEAIRPSRRSRRIALAVVLLVIVLGSLHLLNATLG